MHGEDLLVNDRSDRQAVEAISEGLPELDVITALAFVVEAVNSVDRGTFMVAAQDEEILRVLDLVRQQQADRLQGLLASVYIIAKEEIVGFWGKPAVLKESEEIVVLTMDIAADLSKEQVNLVFLTSIILVTRFVP